MNYWGNSDKRLRLVFITRKKDGESGSEGVRILNRYFSSADDFLEKSKKGYFDDVYFVGRLISVEEAVLSSLPGDLHFDYNNFPKKSLNSWKRKEFKQMVEELDRPIRISVEKGIEIMTGYVRAPRVVDVMKTRIVSVEEGLGLRQ